MNLVVKRKLLKIAVCFILTVCMIAGTMPVNWFGNSSMEVQASEVYSISTDGVTYYYKFLDSGVEITSVRVQYGTIHAKIPETIAGKKVISIGDHSFYYQLYLKSVEIPEGVTNIGNQAFYNCIGLTNLKIPDSVIDIGERAFEACSGLREIEIPQNVVNLGEYAFWSCSSLEQVRILAELTKIPDNAFNDCSNLKSVMLPKSITEIGEGTFEGCNSLEQITIPESVTKIGGSAFKGCSILSAVKIPSGVTVIYNSAFAKCTGLQTVTLSESVTEIGEFAFQDCFNLQSINLSNIKSIKRWAFAGCGKLADITLCPQISYVGYGAFRDCGSITEFLVPSDNSHYCTVDGVLYNQSKTELIQCPAGKSEVNILAGVTKIGEHAFCGCSKLKQIVLPAGITTIEMCTFDGCSALSSIVIPDGVTGIGKWAFSQCSGLQHVELPESVTQIRDYAFDYCTGLTKIVIPRSVTDMGSSVFAGCENLRSVQAASGSQKLTSVDGILYSKDMTELILYPAGKSDTVFAVPNTVKIIADSAFMYCRNLTDVFLPQGLTDIGKAAFCDCDAMKNITIPDSVERIAGKALGYYSLSYNTESGETDKKGRTDFTVLGYSGSEAQYYVNWQNEYNSVLFSFVELKKAQSVEGVTVEYKKELIANGADITLLTKQLSAADKEYQNIIIADKIMDTSVKSENVKFTAYDITIKNSAGAAVQPKGKVTVKMPVPAGYDGVKCKVYYVNNKGEFVDMKAVYGGDYMIFETTHFSTYMITDTQMKAVEEQTAIYGDANSDGEVNSKDVVMMKKHLAGYKVDINLAACDVNGDNTVNSKDVVMVMKKLAGYDVVLGN